MDPTIYLKKFLNEQGQIKNKDLKKIIPELKKILNKKIHKEGMKIRRDNIKELLHEALSDMGWDINQINTLSEAKNKIPNASQDLSPSFKNYKPDGGRVTRYKNAKIVQGGSPGLGKKK